ncbi:MAG TPA: U32 family peptidase [Haloplasmataceae bacterium]
MHTIRKKPELLAPAGSLEKLKYAVMYGADAVYIGGKEFSLRARASNFSLDDIAEGVKFAKAHGAKVYVTTNIIAHNDNLDAYDQYIQSLEACGVDAVICADPYLAKRAIEIVDGMEVHISTQQSITNSLAVNFWYNEGATRIVLGRELSLDEIRSIVKNTKAEIEVFIHGGMCSSYSGRCTLSNNMTGRDANRGGCAHSCRWSYQMYTSDGEKISSDEMAFSFSSRDLMAIRHIPELIEMGVDSMKIEGRMKSIHYIATVVGTYRKLIDDYFENPELCNFEQYYKEIEKSENRLAAEGFLNGAPTENEQLYGSSTHPVSQHFIGVVLEYDERTGLATVEQRNVFKVGEPIEIYGPGFKHIQTEITELMDEEFQPITIAPHPRQIVRMPLPHGVRPFDLIRTRRGWTA